MPCPPLRQLAALLALTWLTACSQLPPSSHSQDLDARLATLPPAQVLLLGEQHDAPDHQRLQERIVSHLAARGALAALVLEMAPQGRSTSGLRATADEAAVRSALAWSDEAWPWRAYGPAVMAAVRAGVPVLGGNLPGSEMREAMRDATLEARLAPQALAHQQVLIREGHCGLLPESQILPMTRVQIARDLRMAQTVASAVGTAHTGQTVVLMSGSVHADRQLGVPRHLPPQVRSVSLRLQAGGAQMEGESFDLRWPTPAVPVVDHCAGLRERFRSGAPGR